MTLPLLPLPISTAPCGLCPGQAAAFGKVWLDGKGRGEGVQVAFGAMRDCMDDFELKAAMAAHKTAQENNTK